MALRDMASLNAMQAATSLCIIPPSKPKGSAPLKKASAWNSWWPKAKRGPKPKTLPSRNSQHSSRNKAPRQRRFVVNRSLLLDGFGIHSELVEQDIGVGAG